MHATVTQKEAEIFEQHTNYIQEKFNQNFLEFVGTSFEKDEEHFAIVIINATSKIEAKNIIDNDPAVKQGLLISHLTEFSTFLSK
ncbi:MAG: hypothetical protein HN952_06015 [Candidatus Cloacimonetes bacterium]|mgnify:CR=1|jgi:uncharacterized protein|nr:hypothetical protein [Candidatus Cloacimonadota bacterium]MBT6994495.1 hypothetical protein [Candidatus Cloacimonadota bacterium]MBT7468963.1 hypothetical protein [Candidatus Cloacimonadota bacterium]